MGKVSIQENNLVISEGIFGQKTTLALNALRLVYLFLPESLKSWFVVSSSSGIEGYNLDSAADESIYELTQKFDDMVRQERAYKLGGIKLCLADYENRSAIVPIKDFKSAKIDIFNQLLHWRPERLRKQKEWLAGNPEVLIRGGWGQQAVLNAQGFRQGKKLLPWNEVGTLQINTVNFSTDLLVIPKGVSSGMFGFKKYKYSLRISLKKKELYIAECDFWRSCEAVSQGAADVPRQIEELAQLKEQGILSEEKFQEAKTALLKGI